MVRKLVTLFALTLLAGCAVRAPLLPPAELPEASDRSLVARCTRALAALDAAVDAAGVRDVQAARMPGFPYLRATRFLASYRDERLDTSAFAQWVRLLMAEDRDARRVEVTNLPVDATRSVRSTLEREGLAELPPEALLEGCGNALLERDVATEQTRARLAQAIDVPDDYDDTARAFGLYPLTRLGFAAGIRLYERSVRHEFAERPRPRHGRRIAYVPADAPLPAAEARRLVASARENPLGIPLVSGVELERLLATYAPVFLVDERDDNDRIGRPAWGDDGRPTVSPAPVVFSRAAYTRFAGRALLQLVYTAWFPARPAAFPGDPLAGRLDGLVWRVTLDADGKPLMFDSIHPCGCFHLFVPTVRVTAKPPEATLDEQALIPATLPEIGIGERVALSIESGTHYLRGVDVLATLPDVAQRYRIAHDDALRTLPRPAGGTMSLFGPDAFVPATERSERAVFWPLGIARAGAMRQWGHHPTAFIGRRHFDEAFLLDRYFLLAR